MQITAALRCFLHIGNDGDPFFSEAPVGSEKRIDHGHDLIQGLVIHSALKHGTPGHQK